MKAKETDRTMEELRRKWRPRRSTGKTRFRRERHQKGWTAARAEAGIESCSEQWVALNQRF